MLKKPKPSTQAQKRANARNQLFRQIHGYNIKRFVIAAVKENAITSIEKVTLKEIINKLQFLKDYQFQNSKELGFNPRRRCAYCNNIAHWKATVLGTEEYLCNKHKEETDRDNKQNSNGDWIATDIHKINPYE